MNTAYWTQKILQFRNAYARSAKKNANVMILLGPVPPAVGTLQECEKKIKSYPQAVFFSSVAEVSDIMNMEEMLSTRRAHEDLTTEVGKYLNKEGYETYILSTESCDICEKCAYKEGKPCRYPDRMHPCLESHGVVVNEIVERESMEYNLGGNTILWFSMVLFR